MQNAIQDVQPHQEVDQDSLFISDDRASAAPTDFSRLSTPATTSRRTPARATPSRAGPSRGTASRAPTQPPLSTFAKIRALQAKIKSKRSRAAPKKPSSTFQPPLDNESFLQAIQNHATSSRSTAMPDTVPSGAEDKKAAADFKRQKKYFDDLRKQHGGNLPFRQDIQWLKIERAEKERIEKKHRDAQKEKDDEEPDDDLFPQPPDVGDDDNRNDRNENDSDEDEFGHNYMGSRKRRRPSMPTKQLKTPTMAELELRSMRVAIETDKDLPKKKRKYFGADTSNESPSASSCRKTKVYKPRTSAASSSRGTKKGGRQSAKDKRATEQAIRLGTSLMPNNVFTQQADEDAPEAPTFKTRNKGNALKELISSLPVKDHRVVKSDMASLVAASKDFDGHGAARISGPNMWLVKGMATSLKPYQLLGSAFMRRRENSADEPRGGLLADQMGLGKTLMMLANIVNGRRKHAECKTTLIVASPALLSQWGREILLHTNAGLKVMRYGAGNRLDSTCSYEVLEMHDIILTTYTEVMNSYPRHDPPVSCQTAEQKIAWWEHTWATNRGALHRMKFHRCVLDEAQIIKNFSSRTSIACRALMANHRWALSGTPIMNSLTELYPYFNYIGVPYTGSYQIFKQNYCDTGSTESNERLLVRLSQFMLRRTHDERMFEAPILKLPRADQLTYTCDFNAVERNVYDIVEKRFIQTINAWQANGEIDKSYSNILVMLLRLRQLSCHILMLQFCMRDLLLREDIERIREVVKDCAVDRKSQRGQYIIAIRRQLDKHAGNVKKRTTLNGAKDGKNTALDDDDEPLNHLHDDNAADDLAVLSGKSFGKEFNFTPYLKSMTRGKSWEKKKKAARCGYGDHRIVDPYITSCRHLVCKDCYQEAFALAAEQTQLQTECPVCKNLYQRAHALDEENEDIEEYTAPETRSGPRKKPERKRLTQEDIAEDWLTFTGDGVLPSAKTIAVKAQIINWVQKNPNVKIIIYTQFLAMVRILAKMCEEEGFTTEQYHGKLSLTARDKAITNFADDPNIRILLASLRCGGLGLNLTMASRVILLDPWWNNSVEQQAFCRVFRFGQTEKTSLARFVVRNTVDDRLLAMQKRKQEEIDGVMEDNNQTSEKMTVRDLMRLFGNLQDEVGGGGKPFILVDNPEQNGFRADADHEGYANEL
ncbi:hypothetical protein CC80DRAFT_431711 [Byssothecium circinans]|uniref:Uncharacterized protein n=1 Tax=Byssothecium circinans TaxID=147558 RepID=A0A6A5T9E3_9PLEO|nr:hypothetical protein CC80DRAFT_431711 [Byssothecium circinans]